MAEITWEKTGSSSAQARPILGQKIKFYIGAALLLGAVIFLIISSTANGARYFLTVDEVVSNPEYIGQTVRLSGAVIGDTIQYDSRNLILDFTIAAIPAETTNLALTLHQAVSDPGVTRLAVHLENEVMPDLLQHESQAIVTGVMGEDGIFYATELLLKCPSRYEEGVPQQSDSGL